MAKARFLFADKLLTDDESLGEAVGRGLFGILQTHAQVRAVAQQALEAREVLRGGDDEHLADARQHQYRQRVVHHRFVENGNKLFADAL